jgi:NADH:ubiquinone oxidoreductase subunit D
MSRCVGIKRDVRLSIKDNYSNYNQFYFKSYISLNGDSYDRFLLRMFEMGESLNIINQCTNKLLVEYSKNNFVKNKSNLLTFNSILYNTNKIKYNTDMYIYMEDLIEHFLN